MLAIIKTFLLLECHPQHNEKVIFSCDVKTRRHLTPQILRFFVSGVGPFSCRGHLT